MNSNKRKKLGLPQNEAKQEIEKSEAKIALNTPISLDKGVKDFTSYSQLDIKNINIGTLRKPVEQITVYDAETQSYTPIEFKKADVSYYYSKKDYEINLNGELLNYKTDIKIDENNPYDPLFSSFNRLNSQESLVYVKSGVTGIYRGEKERFFSLTNNVGRSSVIKVNGAGRALNGVFVPTATAINGRTRYLNNSAVFPADIVWNGSAWIMRQTTRAGGVNPDRYYANFYALLNSGINPTGSWVVTGAGGISGLAPAPTSNGLEIEGFFKLASTRVSENEDKIYATPVNNTGVNLGLTTGNNAPTGSYFVTYPHTYNIQSFPAFRYDLSITFDNSMTGIQDILIISTGISKKKIVYVSPHSIEQFVGFWPELRSTDRTAKTGVGGRVLSNRDVFALNSGNLLSVTSENFGMTGLDYKSMTGVNPENTDYTDFYNYNSAILKQNTPLSQTLFYKLYEPVYRKNTFNTGTWNGIIPSGVPFSIETVRTKNAEMVVPRISVHVANTFVNISPSGSGNYQHVRSANYEDYAGFGSFDGSKIVYSNKNVYEANYSSDLRSKKQAKSKLYGYLWEKGLTADNNKTRKVARLFGTQVDGVNGVTQGTRYCLPYDNPSDPLSCSYTGANPGVFGIKTSYGIRVLDKNSTFIRNIVDEDGNLIKFLPFVE